MTGSSTIKACEIKVGAQIAEPDGFLWQVSEIVGSTPATVTLRLCSDFSSFPAHWKSNGGVVKTFSKSALLSVAL